MFVVFDIETTGFDRYKDDVIQFAYILFDERNMKVQAETLYFYYEGMSWSEEAYNVHHIPQSFLKTHESEFEANLIKMFTVLYGANVCGFNNRVFDCPFVHIWLTRMGIPNLEYRTIQDCMTEWYPIHRRPGGRIKLIKLTEIAGITQKNINSVAKAWFGTTQEITAHDAAYDTIATALLTIQGISKGLISFDRHVAKQPNVKTDIVDSGADKVTSLLETPHEGKTRDPRGYAVKLQMSEAEDDIIWHYLTTDKEKYFAGDCTESELYSLTSQNKVNQETYVITEDPTVFVYHGPEKVYKVTIGEKEDTHSAARNGSTYFVRFL